MPARPDRASDASPQASADQSPPAPRRVSALGLVAAALGLALFAWAVRQAGLPTVVDGIRRVGAGFLVILLLSGARFWVRAHAWALATDNPDRLRPRDTFPALVAGDALGNLTPLGLFVSEPAKAAFLRPRVTLMTALAGIAIENLVYTMSVALMIAAGMVALLFLFEVAEAVRQFAIGALVIMTAAIALGLVVLATEMKLLSRTLEWLDRRNRGPSPLVARLDQLRTLETLVHGFARAHPGRAMAILLLELAFHVIGVAEIWFTLALLAGASAPTLLNTFVLEAVNRTIMVAFKFVPLRIGVDEVGTEVLTRTLGLAPGLGVTMAIVRKARMLAWSAAGVGFLVRRGVR
jgi:hypothetical protein